MVMYSRQQTASDPDVHGGFDIEISLQSGGFWELFSVGTRTGFHLSCEGLCFWRHLGIPFSDPFLIEN